MKKIVLLIATLLLTACGSSSPSFPGNWDGSLPALDNRCPFTMNDNLNALFPMVISEASDGTITVNAATGEVATGSQGEGEKISFTAESAQFGNFGSTAPYSCDPPTSSTYNLSYVGHDGDEADVNLVIVFTNCVASDGSQTVNNCSAVYSGQAVKQ